MPRERHTCTIPGCGGQCVSAGLCDKHRKRKARYGDPLATKRIIGDIEARWWSHVVRRGDDDCWPWDATISTEGIAHFWDGQKVVNAARWGYERFVRPLPDGTMPDHRCHDPRECSAPHRKCPHRSCCNWRHLEPVTNRVNVLRGARTKLSDETVAVLYALHRNDRTPVSTLAANAGVDRGTLYRRFHRLDHAQATD